GFANRNGRGKTGALSRVSHLADVKIQRFARGNLFTRRLPRRMPPARRATWSIPFSRALSAGRRYFLGRRKLPRRRLRSICVGCLCRGSHSGSHFLQRNGGRFCLSAGG